MEGIPLRRIVRGIHPSWLTSLVLACVLAASLSASSAAQASFRFDVLIGGCFLIHGPSAIMTDVTWSSANGHLKGRLHQVSDDAGSISGLSICSTNHVSSGDRITAKAGGTSRSFKVPTLTATFDRLSYHVSGTGPAGSTLDILAHGGIGGWDFNCRLTVKVHTDGKYSINIQGLDGGPACPVDYTPRGGDIAMMTWTSAKFDIVHRGAAAQLLVLRLGGSSVSGAVASGAAVHLVLRSHDNSPRGTAHGHGDTNGDFAFVLRDASGHSVDVETGDHLSGDWAGHASLVAPEMHFTVISVYHWVYGWCMPHAAYNLQLRFGGAAQGVSGTTDENGETQLLNVPGHVNGGETMQLTCAYPTGDEAVFSQRVP